MLISEFLTELNWTRFAGALDSDGNVVDPNDPEATWWSLDAAVDRVYLSDDDRAFVRKKLRDEVNFQLGTIDTTIDAFCEAMTDFSQVSALLAATGV